MGTKIVLRFSSLFGVRLI